MQDAQFLRGTENPSGFSHWVNIFYNTSISPVQI